MKEAYKLNKEWLDLLLEHKNNANVTFNLSNNDIRILLTYIEILQQENSRLKDKLNKINDLLNEPIFEYDNIPSNIENEIIQLKDILKEKITIRK